MDTEAIIGVLVNERDRISRAIDILRGNHATAPQAAVEAAPAPRAAVRKSGRPPYTAAQREAASIRMREHWIARRARLAAATKRTARRK